MAISDCCLQGFEWQGAPAGTDGQLGPNAAYMTGTNPDVAILLVHDRYGWRFRNVRLLADHWAREGGVTVYVPDFFGGGAVDWDLVRRWEDRDVLCTR